MGRKLYVGNLPYTTTEDELRETFEPYGQVSRVAIVMDKQSGLPRGFGFVEMNQDEEGALAIAELHESQLGDRAIKVKEARPRTERNGERRSRSGRN